MRHLSTQLGFVLLAPLPSLNGLSVRSRVSPSATIWLEALTKAKRSWTAVRCSRRFGQPTAAHSIDRTSRIA